MRIIETQKNIFHIGAASGANLLIYYFKRIPFLGKKMPEAVYGNHSLKNIFAVLVTIIKCFGKLFKKAGFIGLLLVLPVFFIVGDAALRYGAFLYVLIPVSLIVPLTSSIIFEADRKRYISIRLLHMNARTYIVSTVMFRTAVDALFLLPAMVIAVLWLGGTFLQGLILTLMVTMLNLIGEGYALSVYHKTGIVLMKKAFYAIIVSIIGLTAAYVPLFFGGWPLLSGILFQPLLISLLFLFTLLVLYMILRYQGYHQIALENLKAADFALNTNQKMALARFANVAVKEEEFSDEDLRADRFGKKKGFAYLNAIFFMRHKRLFVKPILTRLAIIGTLFAAGVIISFFLPGIPEGRFAPGDVIPAFVFIMYFASIGDRVCRAMFYNCDISLLRYAFYRQRGAILSNFRVRLLRIALLNAIVAVAISVAVVGLSLIFGLHWTMTDMASFAITILFLSLFFTVHHLFLYYVFQPYTTELGMKNPFFKIINTAVYVLSFLSMRIDSPPSYFTLIVLISTFVYIVAALILVYRYAPKTFRVK
jgi:hypothetical protein